MTHEFNSFRNPILFTILIYLFFFSACSSEKNIATAQSEAEANAMFDVLYSNGFSVEKNEVKEGEIQIWKIVTKNSWFEQDESAIAIQLLNDFGLPRPNFHSIGSSKESLGISSDREQREKQKKELENQIERQLYTLPNVVRVSVIIAQPENESLSMEKLPAKTSISIVQRNAETAPLVISEIQNLVAGSIPNLEPDNVSVLLTKQVTREIPPEKLNPPKRHKKNLLLGFAVGVILLFIPILTLFFLRKRHRSEKDQATNLLAEDDFDSLPSFPIDNNSQQVKNENI